MATKLLMSEQEYLDTLSNSKRFEFCNGVVTEKRGEFKTQRDHVTLATELTVALYEYRKRAGGYGGQTPTTNLSEDADRLYRIPDLAYWAPGRPVGDSIFFPPTLAIELVSRDQSVPALRDKCRAYRARGIDVCWLIDPQKRTAEVFEGGLDGVRLPGDAALESPHLPGFSLPLSQLFAALDE